MLGGHAVQHLMCELVDQGGEVLGGRQIPEQRDLTARRNAEGGSDRVRIFSVMF